MKSSKVEISENLTKNFFFRALLILIQKPQVINRKLSCTANKQFLKVNLKKDEIFKKISIDEFKSSGENLKALLDGKINYEEVKLEALEHADELENTTFISINKVLPRNAAKHQPCYSIVIIECTASPSASFYSCDQSSKLIISVPYHLTLTEKALKLDIETDDDDADTIRVLNYVVLTKFHRWMENCSSEEDKDQLKIDSHSLISGEEYNELYTALKDKYGKRIEAIWDDESTDPKKFVYEDVAIATYLIILWKQERISKGLEKLQSFVDFGCGNGLLVYILSEEGHKGYGIDVRRRKIWNKYNPQVDLREETWQPSDLFHDMDWIIGNHSDELSSWVPVVASKSSYNCRYFLLPCCAFEFSGAKFSKRVKDKSLYMSFIDYLMELSSNVCGFQTKIDRLKIPSTKRICLIGDVRSYSLENFNIQCQKIDEFVKASSDNKFAPRDKVELVKNCTNIDKNVIGRIVKIIFNHLLKDTMLIDDWNIGGTMELCDAAKLISQDDLKMLKSEFGGLQTLFKNKQNIFEVKNGAVKLRKPKRFDEIKINANKKRKFNIKDFSCYFHENHPQGCFLKENECIYKH